MNIIPISQVVKLSQKGNFLTVPLPPKRAAKKKIKKLILSTFLHSMLICLVGVFFPRNTELCEEKIIILSTNKI